MNLKNITADKLVALYRNHDLTVSEVITNVYDEIERTDGDIRAFISLCRDRAVEEARRMDVKIAAGEALESMAGVPVAIKDNMTIRDMTTTCGSSPETKYSLGIPMRVPLIGRSRFLTKSGTAVSADVESK